MTDKRAEAAALLTAFKGETYVHGVGCFDRVGALAAELGRRVAVVTSGVGKDWGAPIHEATASSLKAAGVEAAGPFIPGPRPNAPMEDVVRIADAIGAQTPDAVLAVGAGSTIDAAKAAVAYLTLRDQYPDLLDYFGTGEVTRMLEATGRRLLPIAAAQLASGSSAHLTKYSNVTDINSAQKFLIVDEAVVPPRSLFDYAMTSTMSRDFTCDGALDGVAHCLEVYLGIPEAKRAQCEPVSLLGIDLLVNHLKHACDAPDDLDAREAIGLGTDLGGYAIMLGGTSGAHLTSFSLVDILSHGRACALMNPYYTVFYAPSVEDRLRRVGAIYQAAGYTQSDLDRLHGRDLGLAVAEAMLALSRDIGFPTTLGEVPSFTDAHIARALDAAKNPKLEMKLKNMPVPLTADLVEDYMGPILEAAKTGDFGLIRNLA